MSDAKGVFRGAYVRAQRLFSGVPPAGPAPFDPAALRGLGGAGFDPAQLVGKVVLYVNVASKCGLTPQYAALQALHERFRERGLLVIGAPCNQFLGQEPGDAAQIAEFCSVNYGVTFPLLEKQDVNGARRSPLYRWLVGSDVGAGSDVLWNFEKFLVGRDGNVRARFRSDTVPDAPELVAAVEAALAEPAPVRT